MPNRVTVELRQLFSQLVNDPVYQAKFRQDFRARRVHPLTEARVWEYHAGRPKQDVDVHFDLSRRFELEAELLRGLNLAQLQALVADSQALIDRAIESLDHPKTLHIALPGKVATDSLANDRGSDNGSFVNSSEVAATQETNAASGEE